MRYTITINKDKRTLTATGDIDFITNATNELINFDLVPYCTAIIELPINTETTIVTEPNLDISVVKITDIDYYVKLNNARFEFHSPY
jgi:hypothetical protein